MARCLTYRNYAAKGEDTGKMGAAGGGGTLRAKGSYALEIIKFTDKLLLVVEQHTCFFDPPPQKTTHT